MSRKTYGMIALIIANLIWAGSYPATALALRSFNPLIITIVRLGVGALVLSPLLRHRRNGLEWRWTGKLLGLALVMGFVGFALPVWLQAKGVGLSTAGLAAISISLEPVFTVVMASLALRQPMSRRQSLAVAIAVVGSWAVAGFPRPGSAGYWAGDVILLVAVICWASYNVFSQPFTAKVPAGPSTAITLLAGFITALPLAWVTPHIMPTHIRVTALIALAFLALFATAGAYLLWMLAMERVRVADAAIYFYLQPIVGVVLSVVMVGTRLTMPMIWGSLLIAVALVLGQPAGRRSADADEDPRYA